jgi:GntR family transcriptional regulator/MocR family aminotransferase
VTVEWSTSAPALLFNLDRTDGTPLRTQLEVQLREAIQSGRLTAGERLPSSRSMAEQLGLSRGLVQDCYAQLQAEGYLSSRHGSATRVSESVGGGHVAAPEPEPAPTSAPLLVDFPSGVPDLGTVPRTDWAWAVREACRRAPNVAFDYGDPAGDPGLRSLLAAYLRRVRAVNAQAGQVVVTAGFAQGLRLVLQALAEGGRELVAVEDPGSIGTVTKAAQAAGGDAVPIRVDEQGLDVDALDRSGARAVVVTPAHQWPTGVVLAAERRHELVAWARARDAVIIEDDYDSEFRYDREAVGSMQGLAPDRVVALGTVSKSLAPALRLGWAVVPAELVASVTAAKLGADRGSPALDQLALAVLMESGRYDRHLRRMRTEYASRRDALVAAFEAHAPQVPITGLAAGFHAVAHLPAGVSESALVESARARGIGVYGMSTYRSDHDTEPGQLVFGFGNTSRRDIEAGIEAIADLFDVSRRAR